MVGELQIIVLNIKNISSFLIQELKVNLSFISVWLTCINNITDFKLFNKTEITNIV